MGCILGQGTWPAKWPASLASDRSGTSFAQGRMLEPNKRKDQRASALDVGGRLDDLRRRLAGASLGQNK